LALAALFFFLVLRLMMKNITRPMRAIPPTPPTTPPTMGPIGVDDPPLEGAEVDVDTGDVVEVPPPPATGLSDVVVVEAAAEELVVEAEGVMVSEEKTRPSLSPL
jgi:hypothetical protein